MIAVWPSDAALGVRAASDKRLNDLSVVSRDLV